jgi:proline iminopeptidase
MVSSVAARPRETNPAPRTARSRWLDVTGEPEHPWEYLPRLLAVTGLVWAVAAARRRLLRWGASEHEATGWFPGVDVVPGARRTATAAVTIDAPPARVWRELMRLDHLEGGGADRLLTTQQDLRVGERLPARADGSRWWTVAVVEPEQFLGLRMSLDVHGRSFDPTHERPRCFTDLLWGLHLRGLPRDRTRLVVSGHRALHPRWMRPVVGSVLPDPMPWGTQIRLLATLRSWAEA